MIIISPFIPIPEIDVLLAANRILRQCYEEGKIRCAVQYNIDVVVSSLWNSRVLSEADSVHSSDQVIQTK